MRARPAIPETTGSARRSDRRARLAVTLALVSAALFTLGTWLAPVWVQRGVPAGGWLTLAYAPLCHQQPERSLEVGTRHQSVCARCSGLYVGATLGLLAGVVRVGRSARPRARWLLIWAIPTAVDALLPWVGLSNLPNVPRWWLALPLGFVAGLFLARGVEEVARRDAEPDAESTPPDHGTPLNPNSSRVGGTSLEVLDG